MISANARQDLAHRPDVAMPSTPVVRVLAEIIEVRRAPQRRTLGARLAMVADTLALWAQDQWATLNHSRSGQSVAQLHSENFHDKFRDERLNLCWLRTQGCKHRTPRCKGEVQ